ncbi:hypothetical protein [Acerihabitans sp.]|uniref:hypothetical protein n=1 Tax=Acerihabitans sp. TaxID=2811394 RepID=UPI002ED9CD7C
MPAISIQDSTVYINISSHARKDNAGGMQTGFENFIRLFKQAANGSSTINFVKTTILIIASAAAIGALVKGLSAVSSGESLGTALTSTESYNTNSNSQGLKIGLAAGTSIGFIVGDGLCKRRIIINREREGLSMRDICNYQNGVLNGVLLAALILVLIEMGQRIGL